MSCDVCKVHLSGHNGDHNVAHAGTGTVAEAEEQLPPPEHLRAPMQQRTATTPARKTSYESLM